MERFSTAEALQLLQDRRVHLLPGVPTMFHYLLQGARRATRLPEPAPLHLGRRHHAGDAQPRIRAALQGAAARRLRHHRNIDNGDDELADRRTRARLLRPAGAGAPRAHRRSGDGQRSSTRARKGELIVRGPNVMSGYHNKPEETAAALRNGWYHTGDLARSDENGFLTITGRLKELIIRGGQNIAPAEIEEAGPHSSKASRLRRGRRAARASRRGAGDLRRAVKQGQTVDPDRCSTTAGRVSRPTRCRKRCM